MASLTFYFSSLSLHLSQGNTPSHVGRSPPEREKVVSREKSFLFLPFTFVEKANHGTGGGGNCVAGGYNGAIPTGVCGTGLMGGSLGTAP